MAVLSEIQRLIHDESGISEVIWFTMIPLCLCNAMLISTVILAAQLKDANDELACVPVLAYETPERAAHLEPVNVSSGKVPQLPL